MKTVYLVISQPHKSGRQNRQENADDDDALEVEQV